MNFNKVIIYIILVLAYLGLSKSLSPSEFGISYVQNTKSLSKIIKSAPVSVILTDIHSTGFIIKTYYHKYKIIHPFQTYEELIVRTSNTYNSKHRDNIGMSVFRRTESGKEMNNPLPPGAVFIGNTGFGNWEIDEDGSKNWRFFRVYQQLSDFLGWGNFVPNYKFFQQLQISMNKNLPFYGFNDEFGTQGSLTRKHYPNYYSRQKPDGINFKKFIKEYLRRNF